MKSNKGKYVGNKSFRNKLFYTDDEMRRLRRKRRSKWKKFKEDPLIIFTPFVIAFWIIAFCLLIYVLASVGTRTTLGNNPITVGTTNADEYRPVKTTIFGIDVTSLGKLEGEVNFNKIGKYVLNYKPFLRKYTRQIEIYVVDDILPTITLSGDAIVYVPTIDEYVEPGYFAYDNYDGNLTQMVSVERTRVNDLEYIVKYLVSDSSNNVVEVQRQIIAKSASVVYLTFDDGPSTIVTPKVLAVLNKYNVKATFFLLGLSHEKEDLVKQEVSLGHTVGLHGFSHEYSSIYTSIDDLMNNFYKIEEQVYEVTDGYSSRLIRFPGGSSNTVSKQYCEGIMTEAVKRVVDEGYSYFDWNVDSRDSADAKTADEIYQNVVAGLMKNRSNVVLLHDGPGHLETAEALERIIIYLQENDYLILPLSYNTNPVRHNVSN